MSLAEMARVLKPGGFLLVTAGNRSGFNQVLDPWLCPALQPAKKLARAILRRPRRAPLDLTEPPKRLGSLRELEGWLSSAGLAKVKAKTVGFPPVTFRCAPVFRERVSTWLNSSLQWLADHGVPGVRWSGMDYLVLAQKQECSSGRT